MSQEDKENKPRPSIRGFTPARAHYYSGNMFVRVSRTSTIAQAYADAAGAREPASLHAHRRSGVIAGGMVSAAKLKKMIKQYQVQFFCM
jgi:hypothetical protein